MKLSNLSYFIDPVILDRGREYIVGGHVILVEEVGNLFFRAEVQGSKLYEVYVELDEDGSVLSSECDCPYDYGPVCKHQAAVLLKFRDGTTALPNSKKSALTSPHKDLKKLLEAESKESLVALILSLMADSDTVKQRVNLHVSNAGRNEVLAECRKLIRSYINNYADNYGFVTWRSVGHAVKGAELAAEKAREAADDANWIGALRINLCILEEMVDMLQKADDSDGTVGGVIEDCLERIHELTMVNDRIQQADREDLFRLLLEASKQPRFDGWPDWQLALLENASHLATTDDLRKKWDEHVSRMISGKRGDTWSDNYFAQRVAVMRYHIIQTYEGEDQAREYLNRHLYFSDFRELAIRNALNSGNYDEVIRLAEEGEAQDQAKDLRGLVKKWKQCRYEAYRRSGELELMRKLGEELVLEGDYSYYKQIKDTYPAAEWPSVYRNMLQKLEKDGWCGDIYTRILVEEQETARLLTYVKKQPARIEDFHPYLKQQFPVEVKELFRTHIIARAAQSRTRRQYQDVCRILRILEKAEGKEEAVQIVHTLVAKYPNKPAFRDELMKLNYR
jgi:hypothetical protein